MRATSIDHMVYDDLGIYRLFALGEDDHDGKRFVREWLGPLLDYDATNRSDLVGTLWQSFESGGNYDSTAHALHIHRSTLRYRLRRIRELSGHSAELRLLGRQRQIPSSRGET